MERKKNDIPTGVVIRNQGAHRSGEENELGTCKIRICDDLLHLGESWGPLWSILMELLMVQCQHCCTLKEEALLGIKAE